MREISDSDRIFEQFATALERMNDEFEIYRKNEGALRIDYVARGAQPGYMYHFIVKDEAKLATIVLTMPFKVIGENSEEYAKEICKVNLTSSMLGDFKYDEISGSTFYMYAFSYYTSLFSAQNCSLMISWINSYVKDQIPKFKRIAEGIDANDDDGLKLPPELDKLF